MIVLASFVIGTAFGSFIGVVAQRLHVAGFLTSRSKCLSCSHELAWKDMMPVVSCLSLRGRCRYCKCYFGYSHAFFELACGVVTASLASLYLANEVTFSSFLHFGFFFITFLVLGVIFLYDIAHKIIPRSALYLFLSLAVASLFYKVFQSSNYSLLVAPFLVATPYLVLFILTFGRGVGFGDVLLYFGVGALLGVDKGFFVLLLSLWIGTLYVIPLLLLKKIKPKSAIPFAPFIITAFMIVFFTGWSMTSFVNTLYAVLFY